VTHDAIVLTTYSGERDRDGDRLLADTLVESYARRGLRASLVLRGSAGFGVRHHMHTDRLLTLSEDLPLVTVAVDRPGRILAAAEEAAARSGDGLITLERASFGGVPPGAGELKLTVHLGRGARAGGRPAHVALVALLRRHGVAGASVLLGVDGTAHGRRRRARFVGANLHVPLIVVSVGDAERIGAALAELDELAGEPLRTLERVRVCKRDGVRIAEPHDVPAGAGAWHRLTVICSSHRVGFADRHRQSRHAGRPLADALIAGLRASGAAGATALRGIWGYHGDHAPHGDRLRQLRRRVPVIVTTVDPPEHSRASFAVIDALTDRDGLVLSELVPAFRASGGGTALGALDLAGPSDLP
jgi:PII-like signaling protein